MSVAMTELGEHTVIAPYDVQSSCGGCQFQYVDEVDNASKPNGYPKEKDRIRTVQVDSGWVNIKQKENCYWCYRFWLEYDGQLHSAAMMKQSNTELSRLLDELKEKLESHDDEEKKL